ncbi:MAG: indolepyruvate oxidoreductase subunit beta [Candidatus Cloacimonetes bacterium]|jgi:indolepyruvate ferredoxin oxidoreductase, beta subunit|nr:indolepyruvate oxidoreductase subunit beta [Candidatus Cloacimonadota bacterium]MBT6994568.1 indolepyruvate oxidoreductase subunit beta [Candidatus Cloacimonadota bacterium]MBT7469178.1 indolepyruvate oxidoreductase subunit beta [Candidatus Cloacimonadota bacterium]
MKKDIILAGVGGQGILSIATIIGYAAIESGLKLKQAEVHGMSQRGGDVQSHLRISDSNVFSDLIPHGAADIIISVEPMEALRYKPYLSENGWFITNSVPFVNIPNYPAIENVISDIQNCKNNIVFDANQIAKDLGSSRSMNMVILGAASLFLDIAYEKLEEGIKFIFGRKGEKIVETNLNALAAGRKFAEENS